jgi:hypothetical protein
MSPRGLVAEEKAVLSGRVPKPAELRELLAPLA